MSNKVRFCPNRDIFNRMNFLYQASVLMGGRNNKLSSYYGNLCKNVGKKSVLRLDPNIKRTLCKKCGIALKPNITSDITLDIKNKKLFLIKCKQCNYEKKFQINSKYKFWLENSESTVETYEEAQKHTNENSNRNDKGEIKSKSVKNNKTKNM